MSEQNSVIQSNYLIRGRKKGEITLREQKLLYLAISMIEPNTTELTDYRIHVRDLYDLLGLGKLTPTKDLKETAEKLVSQRFELPTKGEKDFDFINIVSRCTYIDNEGDVIIRFNKDIEPFLLQLRGNFTSYKLYNILKLKSEYSVALFQFFKSYVYQGEIEITLDELKYFLFFDTTKYPQYSYFKRDLLKKCISEINEKTDLTIDFTEIRKGRRVNSILFKIAETTKSMSLPSEPDFKIRGEKRIQLDQVLEIFRRKGLELSAVDGYNFISKAKTIWGSEHVEQELLPFIESVLNSGQIREPIKFIYYRLKGYEENLNQGLEWNHGFKSLQNNAVVEQFPDFFSITSQETTDDEQIYFEEERKRILEKLNT